MGLDGAWKVVWDVGTRDDETAVEALSSTRDGLDVVGDVEVADAVRSRCAYCADRAYLAEPGVTTLVRAELKVDGDGSAREGRPNEVSILSFDEVCEGILRWGVQRYRPKV